MKYLIIILVLLVLIPNIVSAVPLEGEYQQRLYGFLVDVKNILYYIAMGIAMIMIVVSGIMYITAAGDENRVKTAKKTLIGGIVGAAIVFAAGFIIDAINEIIRGI